MLLGATLHSTHQACREIFPAILQSHGPRQRKNCAQKSQERSAGPDQTGHWFVHMRARLRSHAPAAAHFPLWVATRLARLTCQSSERSERGGHLAWPLDTAADGVTRLLAPATMRCYGHNVVQCSLHCLRTPVCSVHCPTRHEDNTATASFVWFRTFAKCQKLVRHCALVFRV